MNDLPAECVVDWHGWGTDSWSLHVGRLPGRKSLCLYYSSGSVTDALAYFRDEEAARVALAVIDRIARIDGSDA